MSGSSVCHWFACILAVLLLIYTTGASLGALLSNEWFTSSTLSDIGIACAPGAYCASNVFTNAASVSFSWSNLTTNDQKAVAGLLMVSIGLGAIAFFFLFWAVFCPCCLLQVGGALAGVAAFLQFGCLLSAVMIFASMWSWTVPTGYTMGPAYICAIVAIPLALLAAMLAAYHHRSSSRRYADKMGA